MADAPTVRAVDVTKSFRRRHRSGTNVLAVDGVSLAIPSRSTFGLIGESGSGKSTFARCLLRLVDVDSGLVELEGIDVTQLRGRALRGVRARMQLVFQDPYSALDPRMTIEESIAEPVRELKGLRGQGLDDRVRQCLDDVGLGTHLRRRYPSELSGGQCQRVGIARALTVEPALLVLDEPTSALDVSVQAQILNLLNELQSAHNLTYLLITHDLDVVRYMADIVGVMYRGSLVEAAPVDTLFADARHPYSRALLSLGVTTDPVLSPTTGTDPASNAGSQEVS